MSGAIPPVHGAIFDLDGTLLDTLADIAASMNRVLSSLGLPNHPEKAYRTFVGDGMSELVKRVLPPESGSEVRKRCHSAMLREYGSSWAAQTAPYQGIREMLEFIAARGISMAVLSNKPHRFTVEMTRHFFPDTDFRIIRGADNSIPRKPDPAGALAIAADLGVSPENMLYLGDTATDMRCAVSAGMIAIGVTWGFRDAEELRANGAVRLIAHPMEVARIVN